MATNDNMIAALLRERAGYKRRGLDDRVRQVDEQLARYGYKPEPKKRTAPPQQTADTSQGTGDGTTQPQAPAKKTTAKKTATAPPAE